MAAASKVSLKLLIDAKAERVLFAEAGKDFVDFLFNIMNLPVGTVIRLLKKNEMVGSLGNLYESIEKLDETYIEPDKNKNSILKPVIPTSCAISQINPLLLLDDLDGTSSSSSSSSTNKRYYNCGYTHNVSTGFGNPSFSSPHLFVTENPSNVCPSCDNKMSKVMQFVSGAPAAEKADITDSGSYGYVKGVVTYMVMDDLSVMPMSTISSITLLNKFNIKEVGNLEERIVSLNMGEGVKLLKASLESKMVLTSVFLGQKGA